MTPFHRVFLCAVVIVLMITAGCTFPNTSGASQLVTPAETPAVTPVPSNPVVAGTSQPGAAGTQPPGTCTADITSDPANCGGCGYACPANALCQQGQCYCREGYTAENNQCVAAPAGGSTTGSGCPTGMSPCPDGYCYELASSPENCGICGNTCPAGMICSASTCTNVPTDTTTAPPTTTTSAAVTTTTSSSGPSGPIGPGAITASRACLLLGKTMCDGSCVNLSTSTTNCGTCGKVCKSLAPTCCKGACVNTQTDSSNCGTCGHKCFLSTTCIAGSCKSKVIVTGIAKVTVPVKIVDPGIIGPIGPGPIGPGI